MNTASEFVAAIGRKVLAEALAVSPAAVSNHVSRGVLPASWFLVCHYLAECADVECPNGIFNMRRAEDRPAQKVGLK